MEKKITGAGKTEKERAEKERAEKEMAETEKMETEMMKTGRVETTETKRKSEVIIRPAEKTDETAIEIILSTYFLDRDDIAHERFYVAEVNGKVIGCAVFEKLRMIESKEPFYEIHTIAVMPAYKGKGYGKLLLDRLESEIRELKIAEEEKSLDEIFTRTTSPGFFIHEGYSKSGIEKTKYWEECVRCDKIEICSQTVLSKKI